MPGDGESHDYTAASVSSESRTQRARSGFGDGLRRRTFLASTTAATMASVAGCLGSEDDETIRVGLPVPTSGPPAVYGEGTIDAVEFAIETQFDGEIAGREVETLVRDTGGDPGQAVPAADELITEEGADALLGGYVSAACLAMMDVAEREQTPFIAQATSVEITGGNCNRYTFQHSPNSRQNAASVLAAYEEGVFETLHIHHADLAGERDMADATEAVLEEAGGEVVERTEFPPDSEDFSTGISQARDSGADAIFVITHPGGVLAFLPQAIEAGLKEEMEFLFPMVSLQVAEGAGAEAIADVYGSNFFYWRDEDVREFSDQYRDEVGHPPRWWEAGSYEGAMELLSAIDREDGSTDPDAIISQLEGREFDWLTPATWRECDHLTIKDMYLLRGNGPDERAEEDDAFEIAGTMSADVATLPCDEKACDR